MVTLDYVRTCLDAHRPQPADATGRAQAAVSLVLVPGANAGPELLLIRRAEVRGDPWSGQMALPGGRREKTDVDLLATACRETEEETGIDLRHGTMIGVLDDLAPSTPVLPPIVVRPFVFTMSEAPKVTASPEVADHLWTSLDAVVSSAGETVVRIRGVSRTMPAFLLGANAVWGMTHRILSNFIDILAI
jgi:8-oxo-dGTP pyrophosphatase MutT (NUDIX family)